MERTFSIIKPDSVEDKHIGDILADIEKANFTIIGMRMIKMTISQAKEFYAIHNGKAFFDELIQYITRTRVVVLALEKENAVSDFREFIGATNPNDAAPGTIRKKFAKSIGENAIHGSDSIENGLREIGFFFSESELV